MEWPLAYFESFLSNFSTRMNILIIALSCFATLRWAYAKSPSFRGIIGKSKFFSSAYSIFGLLVLHTGSAALSLNNLDTSDLWTFGFLFHTAPISALAVLGNTAGIMIDENIDLKTHASNRLIIITKIFATAFFISIIILWMSAVGSQIVRLWNDSLASIIFVLVAVLFLLPFSIVALFRYWLEFLRFGKFLFVYFRRWQLLTLNFSVAGIGFYLGYIINR